MTRLQDKAEVIRMDSLVFLKNNPSENFDYIYIAPPQYKQLWIKTIKTLDSEPHWLHENGWIIVQIHPVEYEDLLLDNFIEIDKRKYGSTLLIFYEFKLDH